LLRLMRILHIATSEDWAAAQESGPYTVSSRGATLADQGFIHASTSRQAPLVLATFYADLDPAGLCVLVVDVAASEKAGSPVQWDPVDDLRGPFPHIYGPIVPAAVVAVLPVAGELGAPELPDVAGLDVATDAP
jgi:uncharacterized protein (DUF952 family)